MTRAVSIARCTLFSAMLTCWAGQIRIGMTNDEVALKWDFPGILQMTPDLLWKWNEMSTAVASITVPITNDTMFFRVKLPTYNVTDTDQTNCYDNTSPIPFPSLNESFLGQDAQFISSPPIYTNNGDGTITDLNTGLMWVAARGIKMTWDNALSGASNKTTGGYTDWRMPSIKELYSLILFSGVNGPSVTSTNGYVPFIDTDYFDFVYGSGTDEERVVDCALSLI